MNNTMKEMVNLLQAKGKVRVDEVSLRENLALIDLVERGYCYYEPFKQLYSRDRNVSQKTFLW